MLYMVYDYRVHYELDTLLSRMPLLSPPLTLHTQMSHAAGHACTINMSILLGC